MSPTDLLHRLPAPLRRRPVLIAAAVALAVLLVAPFLRPRKDQGSTEYHEVRRGNFTVSIVEGGTLTAVSEVSIRNEVEGTARIIYIVPEGSYVKKGDLLIELDSAQAQDQVNQQNINVEKAQFALVQAQAQLDIQRSTTNSDISAAALRVELAKLDLQKFLEGQQVVSLVEASNQVVKSELDLAVNLDYFRNTTNLAAKGYETADAVKRGQLTVIGDRDSLIIASNNLWMLKRFDLVKQRAVAESEVRMAEQELQRVIAQSERRIAQFEADLVTQSNTLVLSQKKLERDRKNLDAAKLYAPQDGLVVYPVSEGRFSQESLIEEGAVVRNRQELIKLPDTSHMKVTIRVHESHVNMVRPGLPAYVMLDSMPDQRFAGVVEKVALLPDTQARWGNPNLKVYNTDVHITDRLPDVKPGVSAKAEVIITNLADTLSVPIQTVTTLKGRPVVYTLARGDPIPRPVEVGLYNTRFIQVTSGVKEGDRVLLAPPFDSQGKDLEGALLTAEEQAQAATNAPRAAVAPASRPAPAPAAPDGTPALASSTAANGTPDPTARSRRPGPNFADALKEFDKDGDGQLDDQEREAMRTAMAARFGGQGGPGGPGGPGQGGPRLSREDMLKRFDKDGDGEIGEEERTAMRAALGGSRTNRGDRARGGGRGGDGTGPEGSRPDTRNPEAPRGNPNTP